MAQVDPFIIPLPRKLSDDPETGPWFQYTQKFLHDLWLRTGAGDDAIAGTANTDENETITGSWTFSTAINLDGIGLQTDGVQVVGAQLSAVADAAAATAVNPAAPTAYTAHASGGVAVTSDSTGDLDTTAAALATLVSEVATYETAISALIVDVADLRAQVNTALARLRTHGLIDT